MPSPFPLLWRFRRLIVLAAFACVLVAFYRASGLHQEFSFDYLRNELQDNRLSGLLLFVLLFALGNLLHIPGLLFLAAAVVTLGKLWGGLITYVAALVSCGFTFLVVRALGGNGLRLLNNRLTRAVFSHLDLRPASSVFLLRLAFITSPTLNYSLALSGIGFAPYMLGTLLGLPLPLLLCCLLFDQLADVLLG
ncbi:VTT domain-containing protein [Pseudomonas sp. ZM23]|uniref:TVP38/TMEM64 family membrane protein n=1 Tax=Pseudomonas triclosanedens TaxID=2961893 RepID=A0ABY6ZU27_9PSED|nr:VTT domain-containing protein [Pseudomonas triclosanedens]MCP8463356.1 VTT domain-containing protein [Pseudomonas triclosanedens]MCP8469585.1 VTT domain-containing protein [Pseudomonas triclosanedens]MCP8474157.1 VTT domain-containing protein [Pseudomonas triclosanedens]WAI48452.1 VTT domain-containing protein [Pseudomonas triclosanedens]